MGYTSDFLGEALHEYLERGPSRCANLNNDSDLLSNHVKFKFRGDDLQLGSNERFVWANEYEVWEDCAYDDGEGLRRCGYVFWDSVMVGSRHQNTSVIATGNTFIIGWFVPVAARPHRATGWSARATKLGITSRLHRALGWSAFGNDVGDSL